MLGGRKTSGKKIPPKIMAGKGPTLPSVEGTGGGGDEKTWFIPEGENFNPKIPPSFGAELFLPLLFFFQGSGVGAGAAPSALSRRPGRTPSGRPS